MTDRLLTIIAAGGHHALVIRPSATAPALAAHRVLAALPALDPADAARIDEARAASGLQAFGRTPQLRAPHHTIVALGMLGRLHRPRVLPGEVTFAHGGVLLLDGAPEFSRGCVLGLADVLRRRRVSCFPAADSDPATWLPAAPLVVAASDACPCGNRGGPNPCVCSDGARERYLARLDPLAPLFGLIVWGAGVRDAELRGQVDRDTVARLRQLQARRWGRDGAGLDVQTNGDAALAVTDPWRIERLVRCRSDVVMPGGAAPTQVLAVARTIADLDCYEEVLQRHVDEAASLRDERTLGRAGED